MWKKRYNILQILVVLLSISIVVINTQFSIKDENKHLVILEFGTSIQENNEENLLNLKLVKFIKKRFNNDNNYEIIILNQDNKIMYMEEKVDIINNINPNLVLSIQSEDSNEVFEIYPMINYLNRESLKICELLEKQLRDSKRNVNSYYYYLIEIRDSVYHIEKEDIDTDIKDEKTLTLLEKANSPTIVVSNYLIDDDEYLENLSNDYYNSIIEYFGGCDR